MKIEKLNQITPDKKSEGQLIVGTERLFKGFEDWYVSYCNPPSGSWKEILLKKGDTIYRQVGAKRGKGKYKRPDIAAQFLNGDEVPIMLIEAKQKRSSWKQDLPKMLKRYYDGFDDYDKSYGVKSTPFRFKRKEAEDRWSIIEEDEEKEWFRNADTRYVYGFIYNTNNLKGEKEWMKEEDESIDEPVCFIATTWEDGKPSFLCHFSEDFPDDIEENLRSNLNLVEPKNLESFI